MAKGPPDPKNKKAKKKIKLPTSKDDTENKNPHFNNLNHTEELNKKILQIAEIFGDDTVVITHYLDGTAVGTAQKARRVLEDGGEGLTRKLKNEDQQIWVPIRKPVAGGTVV